MSDKGEASVGASKEPRALDRFGNNARPRIGRLDLHKESPFLPRSVETIVAADGKKEFKMDTRDFELLVAREKALNQLYLCRESSATLGIIFPINLKGNLLTGWAQIEQVAPTDRVHALNLLRAARYHALFLKIDFWGANKVAAEENAEDAIDTFGRLLREELADEEAKGRNTEFTQNWLSIEHEAREGIYAFSEEDEDLCSKYYMDDEEYKEGRARLRQMREEETKQTATNRVSQLANSTQQTAAVGGIHTVVRSVGAMEIVPLNTQADHAYFQKVLSNLDQAELRQLHIPPPSETIPPEVAYLVNVRLRMDSLLANNQEWFEKYNLRNMLNLMLQRCSQGKTIAPKTKAEQIKAITLTLDRRDAGNPNGPQMLMQQCARICKSDRAIDFDQLSEEDQRNLIKHFKDLLENEVDQPQLCKEVHTQIFGIGAKPPTKFKDFLERLHEVVVRICHHHEVVDRCKEGSTTSNKPHIGEKRKTEHQLPHKSSAVHGKSSASQGKSNSGTPRCITCGKHALEDHNKGCPLRLHPNANRSTDKWRDSQIGKKFFQLGWEKLPPNKKIVNGELADMTLGDLQTLYKDNKSMLDKYSGYLQKRAKVSEIFIRNSLNYFDNDNTFNPHVFARLAESRTEVGQGILDSGSFGYIANYISMEAYDKLAQLGLASSHKCKLAKVCSVNKCFSNDTCTTLSLEVYSESVNRMIVIPFEARIVKGLPYDFIIGLPSVRRHCLTRVFDYIFADTQVSQALEAKKKRVRATGDGAISRAPDIELPRRKWKRSTTSVKIGPELLP